jgi:hypothetical protein
MADRSSKSASGSGASKQPKGSTSSTGSAGGDKDRKGASMGVEATVKVTTTGAAFSKKTDSKPLRKVSCQICVV